MRTDITQIDLVVEGFDEITAEAASEIGRLSDKQCHGKLVDFLRAANADDNLDLRTCDMSALESTEENAATEDRHVP